METFRYKFWLKNKNTWRNPHKVANNYSAKKDKSLDTFKFPPYRRYFCHNCQQEVNICLSCDHGHKYCPPCKTKVKYNKNIKANMKYRLTLKGKKRRAACESERRNRLKKNTEDSESCKIMGDPPTNFPKVLPNIEKAAEVVVVGEKNMELGEGKNNGDLLKIQNQQNDALGFCPKRRERETILCAYCSGECSCYTYNKLLSKRIYKQRYGREKEKFNRG